MGTMWVGRSLVIMRVESLVCAFFVLILLNSAGKLIHTCHDKGKLFLESFIRHRDGSIDGDLGMCSNRD